MIDGSKSEGEEQRRDIKERTVQFRVDDEQLEALRRKARREGDSLANWARRTLLKDAGWEYDKN